MSADWEREERLTRLVRAAGFPETNVFVADRPDRGGPEGTHDYLSMGQTTIVHVSVASWLSEPEAEATALHELAHVELGHDDDPAYEAALEADRAARTAAIVRGKTYGSVDIYSILVLGFRCSRQRAPIRIFR